MSRTVRLFSMFILLAASLLLLPASAQENAPPAATGKPAEEADAPPDLGENVSADNSVSFPVDI